jgi:Domain of unknown function (DUF4271)
MIISISETQQDTARVGKFLLKESVRLNTFSLPPIRQFSSKDTGKHTLPSSTKVFSISQADTTSVCLRNSITDVTFYNPNNVVSKVATGYNKQFPFIFTDKVWRQQMEEKTLLTKLLKSGSDLPDHPLHNDWMILIILGAVFLYSIVRTTYKGVSHGFSRFFLFRGINDPVSRDIGGLFHWQSTILNLISFLIIGLFAYSVASYYDFIPFGFRGINFWLISLGIICSSVTLRHITCIITGAASGKEDVFRDYLLAIYQAYRFGALFLFAVIILMSYTLILPVRDYIISGIIIVGLMYLIRVLRLLIIFLNRNISIFYLILYLCALEILPVLIVVKYFTGLV